MAALMLYSNHQKGDGHMKDFIIWLEEHVHEYMRISFVWMLASILSPWRIPMLLVLGIVNVILLIIYGRMMKE